MTKITISSEVQKALREFLKENPSAELLNAYLYFVEKRFDLSPVLFVRDKIIYQSKEEAIKALTGEVSGLLSWQRGETGRREGERFERQVVKRAPALFNGGQGGATDKPEVQMRLTALMSEQWARGDVADEDDPFLADLIWWKGTQLAVVEASQQVDANDIRRAARRAAILQQTGVQAIGIVIGEEWMADDTRKLAEARSVQWKVRNDLSRGFVDFRRVAA